MILFFFHLGTWCSWQSPVQTLRGCGKKESALLWSQSPQALFVTRLWQTPCAWSLAGICGSQAATPSQDRGRGMYIDPSLSLSLSLFLSLNILFLMIQDFSVIWSDNFQATILCFPKQISVYSEYLSAALYITIIVFFSWSNLHCKFYTILSIFNLTCF